MTPEPTERDVERAQETSEKPPSARTRALAQRSFLTCYKRSRGEFNFAEANAIWHAFEVVRDWDMRHPAIRAGAGPGRERT